MDSFEKLACDLAIAMRGRRTQQQLAAALGVTGQKVSKWETGHDRIYWTNFCAMAGLGSHNLRGALREHLEFRGASENSAAVFKVLTYDVSPKEVCGWLDCSRATVSRWLSGKGRLPLEVVLSLLHRTGRLYNFVEHFVDVVKLPSMQEIASHSALARNVFYAYPDAPLLLCALETAPYRALHRHRVGWAAAFLGLTKEREEEVLRALVASKLVGFDGKKYFPLTYHTDIAWSSAESFAKTKRVKMHYFKRGLAVLRRDAFAARTCSGGYEVFASSSATRALLRKENAAFYRRVHRILEADTTATDGVTVLQYQFFDLLASKGKLSSDS